MQELINTLREVGLNIDINHSLSRLSIRSSHTQSCLSITQIVKICRLIQSNTALQEIDLSLNNIGAEGAERIANVLQHNTTLQEINLAGNNIGDKGTEHIAKALQGNYSLINITLINQIASIRQNDLEGNIKQALERNKQLVVATARSIYEHFANDGSPELTEQLIATLKFLPLVNQSILQKELLNLKAASDTINYIEKAKNYALDHWLTVAEVCSDRTLQILQELMNKDEVLLYKFNDGKPCDIAKLYKHPAMSKIFSYMPIVPDEHDCDLLLSGVVDIWALPGNS